MGIKCYKCKINERVKNHSYCKECNATNRMRLYNEASSKGFYVYYLPEEHYVGMTNNISQRISQHKMSGKLVEDYEIIAIFARAVDAHWFETMFHMRNYNGFYV